VSTSTTRNTVRASADSICENASTRNLSPPVKTEAVAETDRGTGSEPADNKNLSRRNRRGPAGPLTSNRPVEDCRCWPTCVRVCRRQKRTAAKERRRSGILKNWVALTRYVDDGDLSIDNNYTKRSLRGVAVGRNNWTFLGSDRGGRTMAVLRSFVSSCELLKIDPFAWFQDVLSRIPVHPFRSLKSCCTSLGRGSRVTLAPSFAHPVHA
jgi:hypothetical protein